ncbi:MAG: type II toxin-antitoxin system RelE/ParE family toxin [Clostridiales Family XIII bacterium]|jgi:mRNA interferase RelE/StbE|nr:type II toxin-antitoxin system RelE/ParE family toxin [Clostridiales Family XIII bacterium]
MSWKVAFLPEVADDIKRIDGSIVAQIRKGIEKVAENPLPKSEGGYGEPLGHIGGTNLTGLYKIKFRGIGQRVVYALKRTETEMFVVVIGMREDNEAYREAGLRRSKHQL